MDIDDERVMPTPAVAAATATTATPVKVVKAKKGKKRKAKKVKKMADTVVMPDTSGMGGAGLGLGAGLGGGLLGGILASALFGRNGGLFGANGVDGTVVGGNSSTNTILQTLGDIKASVPLAESQVQLALAGQSANLTATINNANVANLQGQAGIQNTLLQQSMSIMSGTNALERSLSAQTANILSGQNGLERALNSQSASIHAAVAGVATQADRNLFQISQAIVNDGAATRALIVAQNDATLNRIIVNQAAELAELRNEGNRSNDRHGIEINMINNQNQNQLQFQQQAQVLNGLTQGLTAALQSIHATNQAINIGGTQLASPTNTNTNVRA